jgi:ubiquinone/menaquinone biosynthesis C-methylase UbiE
MDEYELLVDLHQRSQRQGPGGDAETQRAIQLAQLDPNRPLKIADLGCGTGAATLCLARSLNAEITAVDFLPAFLDSLNQQATTAGLQSKIQTQVGDIGELSFDDESFDVIWSEGAIYNLGFETGVKSWRRFLKPGGILAASELTWTTAKRPTELTEHWQREYPEVDTAAGKLSVLERHGYRPLGYFVLPEYCWLENYYQPLEHNLEAFLEHQGHSTAAQAIAQAERQEINLYRQHRAYYSYGFYIAQKLAS